MPAPKSSPSLLSVLFWVGIGFAPVAALLLLVADGNTTLRIAAVLALASVVLIGLGIGLSRTANPADAGFHEEIEQLRAELRAEIAAAVRGVRPGGVEAPRARPDAAPPNRAVAAARPAAAAAVAVPPASRPEHPEPAGRRAYGGFPDGPYGGPAEGTDPQPARPGREGHPPPPAYAARPAPRPEGAPDPGRARGSGAAEAGGGRGRRVRQEDEPDDGFWSDLRAESRWGGGTRRAFEADDTGGEPPVDDRWAALPRSGPDPEPMRPGAADRPGEPSGRRWPEAGAESRTYGRRSAPEERYAPDERYGPDERYAPDERYGPPAGPRRDGYRR